MIYLGGYMERQELVRQFLDKYPEIFTDFERSCILNYNSSSTFMPADAREVWDYLGILPNDLNIYVGFLKLLRDNFNIEDRNIIEVGGGVLPSFGRRIIPHLRNGKLTIYDPRLSVYEAESSKLKLVRDKFTKKTSLGDCDLLIGLMPEEAVEVLIDRAVDNGIDFMVALSDGGPHGDAYDFYEDGDEWRHSQIYSAEVGIEKANMGKLGIQYMKEYGNPYPVVYNNRG